MKTILVIAIAIACSVGIVSTVIVVGGMYQQELFEEYVEDSQVTQSQRQLSNPDLPDFDILP